MAASLEGQHTTYTTYNTSIIFLEATIKKKKINADLNGRPDDLQLKIPTTCGM
jgi:hypothetical protein